MPHIIAKTISVFHPFKKIEAHLLDDSDLCGPLIFALGLGFALLLVRLITFLRPFLWVSSSRNAIQTGKIHFGYIYGFGSLGCLGIWFVLNLLSQSGVDLHRTVSILGYCLLPMVLLAFVRVLVRCENCLTFTRHLI